MKFSQKVRAGLTILRHSPGLNGKIHTTKNLLKAAAWSRFARRQKKAAATVLDLVPDQWAEYFLLKLVNRPINVQVIETSEPRLYVVIPELDPTLIFGGYIAFFQFIAHLQVRGVETVILVMTAGAAPNEVRKSFEGNGLVHGVLSKSEIVNLNVGRTIRVGSKDALLCYNWTTAILTSRIAAFLDKPGYSYFVQEDERIFYPNDSYRFLAESLFYREPSPHLICNSQILLEHFKRERLVGPTTQAAVFEQGIPEMPRPTAGELSGRRTRRMVFYGRPEFHAKRNLMTIALMAIDRAVCDGAFNGQRWEFYMIGSQRMGKSFQLGNVTINCLPNQDYDSYRRRLTEFDLGMVLMYAPHPSVPPFELVRSGVVTVVNTTPARTEAWYRSVSGNFEPGVPTVEGLAQAIGRAVSRVGDGKARVAEMRSYHPASWEESFLGMKGTLGHPVLDRSRQRLETPAEVGDETAVEQASSAA